MVLVRDPRDIAISWYYYRCFKTYDTQLAHFDESPAQAAKLFSFRGSGGSKKKLTKRQEEERQHVLEAYRVCEPMRTDPDAVWKATVASADAVKWNASATVMANQTVEAVVGQAADFYCDFLRSATGQVGG